LTARQDAFARGYAEGLPAVDAYVAAFELTTSRAAARVSACRLLRMPKVAARVRELQDAAANRSTRTAAALIAELEQMVDADIGELVRLDVASCEACWPVETDRSREPNPDCSACHGAGEPRVKFNSTADASLGVRRLLRGVELYPNGSLKRLLLHDQMAARIELHRLKGLHIDRSVSVTAHVHVEPLRDMTPAEIADLIQQQKLIP
jgi:hypothetical protein